MVSSGDGEGRVVNGGHEVLLDGSAAAAFMSLVVYVGCVLPLCDVLGGSRDYYGALQCGCGVIVVSVVVVLLVVITQVEEGSSEERDNDNPNVDTPLNILCLVDAEHSRSGVVVDKVSMVSQVERRIAKTMRTQGECQAVYSCVDVVSWSKSKFCPQSGREDNDEPDILSDRIVMLSRSMLSYHKSRH
eukprot:770832-Amphidinium_carterae.1